jgi:5'-nucleotidase
MRKRILITGDDGYNSIGVRILTRLLKTDYDVCIAATLNQQSSTGGQLSLNKEFKWGEEYIEGVKCLWVDGTPADAIEVAQSYYNDSFDLIVSGINYGENLSYSLVSSGTFSVAVRAIGLKLAPKAIVLSLQTTKNNVFKIHQTTNSLESLMEYPGKKALEVINHIINNDFYNTEIVNVNFPMSPSHKYQLTKVSNDITKLWKHPLEINRDLMTAKSPEIAYSDNIEDSIEIDTGALQKGYISISPINYLSYADSNLIPTPADLSANK